MLDPPPELRREIAHGRIEALKRSAEPSRRTGRRPAVLVGLVLVLALVIAPRVAAYPTTPEGEPLHFESTPTYSPMAPEAEQQRPVVSSSAEPVPLAEVALTETDSIDVTAIVAAASLAALALIAAAFARAGRVERS